ncbi:ABC transporter substrate-binding protein [Clostridium oryzae]|uniref:Bacterial extracellular solute-binding protein n=1 Tax=Clostridium oryzae TaxID=1450648 RepID=A0A1V4I637_9CLOT|nr:extracellular solute-binding protein [Clostridium oryzae]OPJ55339.1 hypothetical protein CLORY_44310 [Clostridium oryzae]
MKKSRVNRCIISMVCIFFLINICLGCGRKEKSSESNVKINVYVGVKDKTSLDIVKFLLEEYTKKKSNVEVSYNNTLGDIDVEKDIVDSKIDLLFISRNEMIELCKKGLLLPMEDFFAKNKVDESYYNIVKDYGRIGDNYYGLGLIPFSLEFMYNKSAINKLNVEEPIDAKQLVPVIMKNKQTNTKIPVFLNDNISITEALSSIVFSNSLQMSLLEDSYGDNIKKYKAVDMQKGFQLLDKLAKSIRVPIDIFEKAEDMHVQKLISGDAPIVIATSAVLPKISGEYTDIKVVKNYNITDKKSNVPVIVNCITSIPANSKKQNEVSDILEFLYGEDMQKKLAEKKYVTGNKKVNDELLTTSMMNTVKAHLETANENSILYIYDVPEKLRMSISSSVENILKGSYSGKEWSQILEKVYNK